jgi:hypothetical protein
MRNIPYVELTRPEGGVRDQTEVGWAARSRPPDEGLHGALREVARQVPGFGGSNLSAARRWASTHRTDGPIAGYVGEGTDECAPPGGKCGSSSDGGR